MSILFQMSGFPRFTHVGSPPISADRGVDKQGDPFNLDLNFFLSSSSTFVVSSSPSSGHKGKRKDDVRGTR
jgi:hypothetical protein